LTALRPQSNADPEYNVQDIDQWRPEGLGNGWTGRVGWRVGSHIAHKTTAERSTVVGYC
jgi:hypothetical protein